MLGQWQPSLCFCSYKKRYNKQIRCHIKCCFRTQIFTFKIQLRKWFLTVCSFVTQMFVIETAKVLLRAFGPRTKCSEWRCRATREGSKQTSNSVWDLIIIIVAVPRVLQFYFCFLLCNTDFSHLHNAAWKTQTTLWSHPYNSWCIFHCLFSTQWFGCEAHGCVTSQLFRYTPLLGLTMRDYNGINSDTIREILGNVNSDDVIFINRETMRMTMLKNKML